MVSTVPSPVVTVLVLILATNRPGLVVVDVNSGMSVLTQMDPTLVRLTSVSTVYIQLMDIILFTLLCFTLQCFNNYSNVLIVHMNPSVYQSF